VDTVIDQLIRDVERDQGSPLAAEQLFQALYGELHRLAERQLRRAGPELTLGATTLLHEAYLHLAGREGVRFPDRARFMGYAARAMRCLVIDYARRSRAQKRGGGAFEITLTSGAEQAAQGKDQAAELERLSEALDELALVEPALAQLVDLHFFCGYRFEEIAAMRGVSDRTVQRDWRKARLLLHRALGEQPEPDPQPPPRAASPVAPAPRPPAEAR
jgi:RNA polymerase sigma factor (TIGR02999 family)